MSILKELVKKEAENLRVSATVKERQRLDLSCLDPDNPRMCIYGQMTGNCFNERSYTLIRECCTQVYSVPENIMFGIITRSTLNGKPYKLENPEDRQLKYFSPIEKYIMEDDADTEQLVAYIKGETDTLDI